MAMQSSYKDKMRVEVFHFSVRLKGIFFPLTFDDLAQILGRAEFNLAGPLKQAPMLPSGTQFTVAGRIAEKGDHKFNVDPDKGVIGLEGKNIADVLSEFAAIEELARKEFAVGFNQQASFYESVAILTTLADKDPTVAVSGLFSDSKAISSFSAIMEEEVGNYGVRLVKRGQTPNQEEWWEYRIEPLVSKPNSTYLCNAIYRSKDKAKVINAANELINRIEQLILTMEQL